MASVTTIPEFEDLDERPEPMRPRDSLEDTEMDITPMIDITFLLLIFFIVSSKMDPSANVPLPAAKTIASLSGIITPPVSNLVHGTAGRTLKFVVIDKAGVAGKNCPRLIIDFRFLARPDRT